MLSTKVFCLLFVLCFALGSLAQLDSDDQVAVYDQITLPATLGTNITGWINSAPGASGVGDLVTSGGFVSIQQCGTQTGAGFDGSSFLSTSFTTPITITSTQTVVVIVVAKNTANVIGRQGILSTSNEIASPWSEGSVGPGAFVSGTEFYEDASFAKGGSNPNVAGTTGISQNSLVALGFVYQPDVADTADDYVVINGPTVQYFSGATTTTVQTTGAFSTVNVGFRASGLNANQHFTGCICYLSVYVVDVPVEAADVALTVMALSARFATGASTPGNNTVVPSPSPVRGTTTTGRSSRTTTTGRKGSTGTTGRKGTTTTGRRTGKKAATTGISAASLPFVAPAIQAFFVALVSLFLFFMW